jgi:hypothetical protein
MGNKPQTKAELRAKATEAADNARHLLSIGSNPARAEAETRLAETYRRLAEAADE